MEIASWGSEVFSVDAGKINNFRDLSISSSLSVESQENDGDKPATYIKGNELESLTFSVSLRIDFIDVRQKINDWIRYKNEQKPYPFILGGKQLGANSWLLQSVEISNTAIGANGIITSADLNISMQEYVRAGKKTTSTSQSSGAAASSSRKKSKEPTSDEIDALFAAEMAMADTPAVSQPTDTTKLFESAVSRRRRDVE